MTKDLHGCDVRQAGRNVLPREKPVITKMPTPEAEQGSDERR
jgi:hypothetical protein